MSNKNAQDNISSLKTKLLNKSSSCYVIAGTKRYDGRNSHYTRHTT